MRDDGTSGPPKLTLPSIPAMPAIEPDDQTSVTRPRPRSALARLTQRGLGRRGATGWKRNDPWDDYADVEWESADNAADDALDRDSRPERTRAQRVARPLPVPVSASALPEEWDDPTPSAPELAAYRPSARLPRTRTYTRRLVARARRPGNIVRAVMALAALIFALTQYHPVAGEPSQPRMSFHPGSAGVFGLPATAARVKPLTQGVRKDQYDSEQQYNDWWGSACSAAALAEILTAYDVPDATIGHMIDELGADISPYAGLLTFDGFDHVADKHGLRADFHTNPTYEQLLHITNDLGTPVIVNVRISYGFYHFFSGGHFLVMTGGDDQGVSIVDSSLYYITYLPKDVFYSMFTGRTAVIVPKNFGPTI